MLTHIDLDPAVCPFYRIKLELGEKGVGEKSNVMRPSEYSSAQSIICTAQSSVSTHEG